MGGFFGVHYPSHPNGLATRVRGFPAKPAHARRAIPNNHFVYPRRLNLCSMWKTKLSVRTVEKAIGLQLIQRLKAKNWLKAWCENRDGTITFWFSITIAS
jgi:hypothetical protein